MNYTEKYHLPQWEETDRIMRVDFNQMCADIEEGIAEAKSTADTAQAGAVEAAKLPYAVGSYAGAGAEQTINVGFYPSLVIILTQQVATSTSQTIGRVSISGRTVSNRVTLVENGFRLDPDDGTFTYPYVNRYGYSFQYIAFR